MQTPLFVTGPYRLDDRSLIVRSPDVAILFKNGLPLKALAPGIHRALFSQLPLFGELEYLLFDAASFGYQLAIGPIHLRDASIVSVDVTTWVEPAWLREPSVIFGYAEQFGQRAERYLETVEVGLFDALRREILRACEDLTHDEFLRVDLGSRVDVSRASIPLARVVRVVAITPVPDPQAVRIRQVERDAEATFAQAHGSLMVRRLNDDYERERLLLSREDEQEFTAQRDLYDDQLSRRRALARAAVNAEVGQILGVDAWTAAYPEAANERRLRHVEALTSMLTEYRDMLSPEDIRRATQALVGGGGAPGGRPGSAALPRSLPEVAEVVRSELTSNSAVLRSGVGVGAAHDRVIVCIAAGVLPGAAIVRSPGQLADDTGAAEVNAIEVSRFDGVGSVAVSVFENAFEQQGMPGAAVSAQDSADAPTDVRIVLRGTASDAELVSARLHAWTEAVRALVAPDEISVAIEVA